MEKGSEESKPGLRARFAYWYDNFMARGGTSMFVTLTVIFITALVLLGSGAMLISGEPSKVLGHLWWSFLHLTDPGSMAEETELNPLWKALSVLAGMIGLVIFSVLIAFITTQFERKLEELKKGKSAVLENGHTLILGWSEKIVDILRELVLANESEKSAAVVILAPTEKEEMDDFLHDKLPNSGTTKIITRSGEISSVTDLAKVNVRGAKSIIILPQCSETAQSEERAASDALVIKAILAISANPQRRDKPYHIVTELFSRSNIDVAKSVAEHEVTVVSSGDLIGKLLVQTARSTGLAVVYNEICSFDGCEIYITDYPDPSPLSFEEAMFRFPDGVLLGIRRGDGTLLLNPGEGETIQPGDSFVLVAEDDSTISFKSNPVVAVEKKRKPPVLPEAASLEPERALLLGWSSKAQAIIREYAEYVCPGSAVHIVVEPDLVTDQIVETMESLDQEIPDVDLRLIRKSRLLREDLMSVDPFGYRTIIILAKEQDDVTVEKADSETIFCLLLLRDIQQKSGSTKGSETNLITEILDARNRELIEIARVNDFIVSNQLVSMILAQVSEQKEMFEVYDDLFQADGSEIYLKPVEKFLSELPCEISFAELMTVARERAEVALGYKLAVHGGDASNNFGVVLNPQKGEKIRLIPGDSVVVLAEDER